MQNSRFSGLAKKAGIFSIGKIRDGHFEIPGFGFWILDFKKSWIWIGFRGFIQKNPNPRKKPSKSKLDHP